MGQEERREGRRGGRGGEGGEGGRDETIEYIYSMVTEHFQSWSNLPHPASQLPLGGPLATERSACDMNRKCM